MNGARARCLEQQLAAIEALHCDNGRGACAHCTAWAGNSILWPCPTARLARVPAEDGPTEGKAQ